MYEIYNDFDDYRNLTSKSYLCGHCGEKISSCKGFKFYNYKIYECHNCRLPTIFINSFGDDEDEQIPGSNYGDNVFYLPSKVDEVYEEARKCFSVGAFTSSILCCRKILMNCAVEQGEKEGKKFSEYINFLEKKGYIPPNIIECVDKIRKMGNEGTHKIESKNMEDAKLIIDFTSIVLKMMYEMPGKLKESKDPF